MRSSRRWKKIRHRKELLNRDRELTLSPDGCNILCDAMGVLYRFDFLNDDDDAKVLTSTLYYNNIEHYNNCPWWESGAFSPEFSIQPIKHDEKEGVVRDSKYISTNKKLPSAPRDWNKTKKILIFFTIVYISPLHVGWQVLSVV